MTQEEDKQRLMSFNPIVLSTTFKNAFPLWCKMSEKCRFKDFVIKMFEKDLKIKFHSRQSNSKDCKVYYYTIPNIDPIYIRDKSECEISSKEKYSDERDKGSIIFDLLVETVHEAFTSEKAKRSFDNSTLEFFGEGLVSLFFVWESIIQNTNLKAENISKILNGKLTEDKLFEIISDDKARLYEYVGIPVHKTLEFFIPPVIKPAYYLAAKFFDRNHEIYSNFKDYKGEIIKISYNAEIDGNFPPAKNGFIDYLYFISMLNKEIYNKNDQSYNYSYSTSMKKEISRYFKGVNIDYLNKNDFISIFKALIGAIYNCSGAVGASRIMKKFELLSDECIFAYDNDIKTKFKQYEPYLKINDLFTCIEFNEPFDIDFPAKLINELTDYRFKNQHILLVALTHKSKSIYNNASIWDNNQIMSLLGTSAIKFFNCKRIISKRKDFILNNRDSNFSKIQKLRLALKFAERSTLLSLICIKSGIFAHIRHNEDSYNILKYKRYVDEVEDSEMDLDELYDFHCEMLSEVATSIIGAILIDSCSVIVAENAWNKLFVPYLEVHLDNLKPSLNFAFADYCKEKMYLVNFAENYKIEVKALTPETLQNEYDVKSKSSKVSIELIYNGLVAFRRFYDDSQQHKYISFMGELKHNFTKALIPSFENACKIGSHLHRNFEMQKHDCQLMNNSHKSAEQAENKENNNPLNVKKVLIELIERDKILANKQEKWSAQLLSMFDEWFQEYFIKSHYQHLFIHDISTVTISDL